MMVADSAGVIPGERSEGRGSIVVCAQVASLRCAPAGNDTLHVITGLVPVIPTR
ncbi:hypothetical protein J4G37_16625 [Microvirga sp. 3-52]|nr:hypothetical protein [Microvirga sp. 3-52]